MSLQPGLSFEQAPPIGVPLRFFLAAPWFAVLAALVLLWHGPSALDNRWLPTVLAATHLLTLGFLGLVMTGAMMQMLPVVAGSPVARPRLVAGMVFGTLLPGILLLVAGFLWLQPWPMRLAMPLLGTGFAVFLAATGLSLQRAQSNPTVSAMKLAVGALAAAVVLGLVLASNYGWGWWLEERLRFTTLHLGWGLLGWVVLLVAGVAYQVVPMFQLTPPYPKPLTRWLAVVSFAMLLLWSAALFVQWPFWPGLAVAIGLSVFAGVTLRLQFRRRRKLPDATLWLWRAGMACLLAAAGLWLVAQAWPQLAALSAYPLLLGILVIVGFGVSVVNGMLYKIVPFLIWFHLQSQLGAGVKVPNMKEILPERLAWRQMWAQFAALPLLLLAAMWPLAVYLAATLFAVSMGLLGWNLMVAYGVYRRYSPLPMDGMI